MVTFTALRISTIMASSGIFFVAFGKFLMRNFGDYETLCEEYWGQVGFLVSCIGRFIANVFLKCEIPSIPVCSLLYGISLSVIQISSCKLTRKITFVINLLELLIGHETLSLALSTHRS